MHRLSRRRFLKIAGFGAGAAALAGGARRGLQATYAPNGPVALELVSGEPARFDAIITDWSMPRMNGLQLAQALRARGNDRPIVLYTGYGEGLSREELEAAGIGAVLHKPIDPAALEGALRAALGPAARVG